MTAKLHVIAPNVTEIPLQDASLDIWDSKYRLKTKDGVAIDRDIDETYQRVAKALAEVETDEEKRKKYYKEFLWALRNGAIPAGRITSNAGALEHKPATSTINCTVSGTIADSMDDILHKVHEAGLTLKAGCGIGYEFSTLRPKDAYVSGAGAYTSGPLSFMDIYDKMCFTVSSAGGRRGAQMATFDVAHPDVVEFIRAKREDGRLRQFNLSLLITSEFMQAVKNDQPWALSFPVTEKEVALDKLDLNDHSKIVWRDLPNKQSYITNEAGLVACRITKTIPARRLWDIIMSSTYDYAEPGFILIDKVNEMNNNWFCEQIRATNPCGEQPLPPYGSCWTGSMRLNTNHGLIRTDDAYELVQQGKPLFIGVDDIFSGNKTDLRPCTLVRNGEKEVFDLRFSNGQHIELTADHRVYTPNGWKEVQELALGSEVFMQGRELSHLSLLEPFYLGVLKYFFAQYQGDEIVISRADRRAFLRPLLDQFRINYTERSKGLFISRQHPAVCEIERLALATASKDALQGYAYAALATAMRYRGQPTVYGNKDGMESIAQVMAQLSDDVVKPVHHGKDLYRLRLPNLQIHAPTLNQRQLNLDFALYGWLMADGWLTESTGLLFSDQDDVAMELLAPHFQALTGTHGQLRKTYTGQQRDVYTVACYQKSVVQSLREHLGLNDYTSRQLRVPERVFQADSNAQASFLAAAFCADGGINQDKLSIRLTSASRLWLEDIQLLLLNFGIHGTIQSGISKGNVFYNLRLLQGDTYRFYRYIGFPFSSVKQAKLERLLSEKQRWREVNHTYTATLTDIRSKGIQPVYDIEEFSTHTLIVNGVVVHNCLLGSINLTKFVKKPFTKDAYFDWETYRKVVRVFTRMLDNVVEINGLPLEKQRHEIESKRRHGMGYLGLGSTMTMLGLRYGDAHSVEFTEEITKTLAVEGWKEALNLAKEKGVAPILEQQFTVTSEMLHQRPEMITDGYKVGDVVAGKVLHAKYSRYMQKIAQVEPELVAELAKVGARFTHHSSIAPTGTISLSLANNASNGIEPSFAHHYSRNIIRQGKKSKEKVDVYSFELLAYREMVNPDAMPYSDNPAHQLPAYFIAADDVTPKQHVDIQAAAQRWVDSSISKTANVPTDFPYEEFKSIYEYAYDQGLKGCTTFRFNPEVFQGVLVKTSDLENTTYQFTLEDGSILEVKGNEEIEYDGEIHTAANLFDALKEGYYGKL